MKRTPRPFSPGTQLAMFDARAEAIHSTHQLSSTRHGHENDPRYAPRPTGHIIVNHFSGRCCRCDSGWIESRFAINVAGPDESPLYRVLCNACHKAAA